MKEKQKVEFIVKTLDRLYPDPEITLRFFFSVYIPDIGAAFGPKYGQARERNYAGTFRPAPIRPIK